MAELAWVSLRDVHPFYGGVNVWVSGAGWAVAQKVGAGHERRCGYSVTAEEVRELERLIAESRLERVERNGWAPLPDEGCPEITVCWENGTEVSARKWARDRNARFEGVYERLKELAERTMGGETLYAGAYDELYRPFL